VIRDGFEEDVPDGWLAPGVDMPGGQQMSVAMTNGEAAEWAIDRTNLRRRRAARFGRQSE
jgi:hypothetical protein